MRGQFFDFRNALVIAHLAPRRHTQQGMLAFRRTSTIFFPRTPLAQRTHPVSSSVASVRQFSRVQALEREAVAAMPGRSGCLDVWLSCTSGSSGTSGVSERERKPLDLILWLPFRGLSAHRDSRLAPCKIPHPVLFGPVLPCTYCPVLPCPWTMQ
jgi:hypothetical protein